MKRWQMVNRIKFTVKIPFCNISCITLHTESDRNDWWNTVLLNKPLLKYIHHQKNTLGWWKNDVSLACIIYSKTQTMEGNGKTKKENKHQAKFLKQSWIIPRNIEKKYG